MTFKSFIHKVGSKAESHVCGFLFKPGRQLGVSGNYLKNLCTATCVYSINFNLPAVVPVLPLQSLKSCISRRQRSYLASELSSLAASNDHQLDIDMSLGTSAVYLKVGENKMKKLLHGGIFICSCSLKKQRISLLGGNEMNVYTLIIE